MRGVVRVVDAYLGSLVLPIVCLSETPLDDARDE